jgi:hypothetical protein
MKIVFACILTLMTVASASCAEVENTSVCRAVQDPEHFNGREVSISSILFCDPIHFCLLVDPACKDVGIDLKTSQNTKGADELFAALGKGRQRTVDNTVTATFVGRFLWFPHGYLKRELEAREIRGVEIKLEPNPFLTAHGLAH